MIFKTDENGESIRIDPDTNIVRVDGIIFCKRMVKSGKVYLQFKDGDRMRSRCRGTVFVEVPLEALTQVLK